MYRWFAVVGVLCLTPLARADVFSQVDGPLLVGDLNCVACHAVDAAAASRVMPKASADLSQVGRRVTPQYLRNLLADPQKAKPGTSMPDVLPAKDRAEIIDDLVQYLVSLGGPMPTEPAAAAPTLIGQGERLYHTVGCVACHQPNRPPPKQPEEE